MKGGWSGKGLCNRHARSQKVTEPPPEQPRCRYERDAFSDPRLAQSTRFGRDLSDLTPSCLGYTRAPSFTLPVTRPFQLQQLVHILSRATEAVSSRLLVDALEPRFCREIKPARPKPKKDKRKAQTLSSVHLLVQPFLPSPHNISSLAPSIKFRQDAFFKVIQDSRPLRLLGIAHFN